MTSQLLITCKKYPEDKKWNWHNVQKRIQHKWELKEWWLDSDEKTNDVFTITSKCESKTYTTSFSLNKLNIEFRYYRIKNGGHREDRYDVHYSITDIQSSTPYTPSASCITPGNASRYSLIDKKNKLQFGQELFTYYDLTGIHPYFNLENNPWDIKKLTDTEMTIETTTSDNKKVRLKFNRL